MKRIYPLQKDINEQWFNNSPHAIPRQQGFIIRFFWFGEGERVPFLPAAIGDSLSENRFYIMNYCGFNLDVDSMPSHFRNIRSL